MKVNKLTIFFILLAHIAYGQTIINLSEDFSWHLENAQLNPAESKITKRFVADKGFIDNANGITPLYSFNFPLPSDGELRVKVINLQFADEEYSYNQEILPFFGEDLIKSSTIYQEKEKFSGNILIQSVLNKSGILKPISHIEIEATFYPSQSITTRTPPNFESILNSGTWYKFQIQQEGIHVITGSDLKSIGIDINALDVNAIQIYGNQGGLVPRSNSADRTDDLNEIPIMVFDGDDQTFDDYDKILFYAENGDIYKYDESLTFYKKEVNPYDFYNYIYLKIDGSNGKRIQESVAFQNGLPTKNSYLHISRYEEEKYNLLEEEFGHEGSNLIWFGDQLSKNYKTKDYSSHIDMVDYIPNSESYFSSRFANRSGLTSNLKFEFGDYDYNQTISSVNLGGHFNIYARIKTFEQFPTFPNSPSKLQLSYNGSGTEANLWIDYIEWQYYRQANYKGTPINMRIRPEVDGFVNMTINGSSELMLWNIKNYHHIESHKGQMNGNATTFTINQSEAGHYFAFSPDAISQKPIFISQIENQNLHGIVDADMVILTHHTLIKEAEDLAKYRRAHNNMNVEVIDVEQIYNEFGSGKNDPSAIRDFIKMIYDRDPMFNYVLLFGRGSFDYRGIKYDHEKFNLVPVFESTTTDDYIAPLSSHPSDDFYALLNDSEGGSLIGKLDVAIGRIPVMNSTDARQMVDKIVKYETSIETLGPWNLTSIFAADDEDGNLHVRQMDQIADTVTSKYPNINPEKIYFDAFQQKSTPGGERYPEVSAEINKRVYKGALVLCYLGHGGPSGWAQERVLQVKDINSWRNIRSFPLFITATCTFAPYDDPSVESAGEKVILNKYGGIGLFTTSRPVYANDNKRLTTAVFEKIYEKPNGEYLPLGEILRQAKNANSQDTLNINARKFSLLGDPALQLRHPKLEVYTSEINGVDVTQEEFTDTLRALSAVKIKGFIGYNEQMAKDFNGEVSITFYDKDVVSETLGQDKGSSKKEFKERKNIIFKGNAEVVNGEFQVEFYIPKDILFYYGTTKISYYAHNNHIGAAGYYDKIIVGGSEEDPIQDDTPPKVEVYMNNESFISGGLTHQNPLLLVKISDDYGINLSGTGVGHDLVAVLDQKAQSTYILNDFFESELNNFKEGTVKYPFSKLENGLHSIRVKAWDIANNVGEGSVEFIVSDDPEEALKDVFNYPNPFSDQTVFRFDHNFQSSALDVEINIFQADGTRVKTLKHQTDSNQSKINDISWDGHSDSGAPLSSGVYLYQIVVRSIDGNLRKESSFEKLVLIK